MKNVGANRLTCAISSDILACAFPSPIILAGFACSIRQNFFFLRLNSPSESFPRVQHVKLSRHKNRTKSADNSALTLDFRHKRV